MSFPMANLENLMIPLKEVELATGNFGKENLITDGVSGEVYKGKLSERRKSSTAAFKRFIKDRCHGKAEFLNELKFISSLNHENIVPFIGYCDESNEMIIVYEYPVNGSLKLNDNGLSCLTWAHRLKICMDVARALSYLHSGLGEYGRVIHGSVAESNIFLDNNLKAKICGFDMSVLIPRNQPRQQVYKPAASKRIPYMDPIYLETGFLKAESDVYSFGWILYGMLTWSGSFNGMATISLLPKSLPMFIKYCCDNRLDRLIDPLIRDQIGGPSFHMIHELTCKCISYSLKDRPAMDMIVKTIEEALNYHNQETVSSKLSGEYRNPRKTIIPLEEIKLATRNFSEESRIRYRIEGATYIGQLSDQWQKRMAMIQTYHLEHEDFPEYDGRIQSKFLQELDIISRIHHNNIIPYIGHCNEDNEMIIVYEHAINGSLRDHLQDPDKLRCLDWEQRLKICLGVARGLKYLHSGFWEDNRVVHRYVRSQFILLDENMEAKISEFALSTLVSRSKPQTSSDWKTGSPEYDCKDYEKYMDPIYKESYIVNTEIDVYSFGVVMFEILSGLMASEKTSFKDDDANANDTDKEEPNLIKWVHRYYGDDELEKLLDPSIKDQIHGRSLHIIAETAYKCLSYNIKERPSMNRIVKRIEEALYIQNHRATELTTTIQSHQYKKLNDLRISLKEINMATSNFSDNFRIGNGGFGVVYKGQFSKQWPDHEVAIKRLNKTGQHVKTEFLNELNMIHRFHHRNIIRFLGYCNEADEMIFVYEYAVNGSLESHLENPNKIRRLTWVKRLKICLGAAKGLDYLHSGLGEDNRVIHRDVKSGNILLDDNMEAKICDFGFSKSDSTKNLQQSQLYTKVAGTNYYMDPIYHESGILRTESDVYSFGVVMFEMLSGMLAWYRRKIGDGKPQPLINLVRQYYDYGKELLIDPRIKDQIDKSSFQTFIDIAYQCISFNSKKRPTMEMIIDKIEEALDFQVKMEVSS